MHKVFKVAWREYKSTVRSKGFVIGLVVAFIVSFFFSANTVIYSLIRNKVDNTAVEDGVVIHAGGPDFETMIIGDMVNIGHGAVIHCERIGNNVLIGMNATVLQKARIGNYCLIAAGCLVSEGLIVSDNSFVAGVPGKIKGKVTEKQSRWLGDGILAYAEYGRKYKAEGLGG